jgi:hypothetical protein
MLYLVGFLSPALGGILDVRGFAENFLKSSG